MSELTIYHSLKILVLSQFSGFRQLYWGLHRSPFCQTGSESLENSSLPLALLQEISI
jgi:hypothetical protein